MTQNIPATLFDYLSNEKYEFNFIKFPHQDPFIYKEQDWQKLDKLGNGSFGQVYKCKHVSTGKEAAFKECKEIEKPMKDKLKDYEMVELQIKMHENLSNHGHRNIIHVYGFIVLNNKFTICMEIMNLSLNDVYNFIHESGEKFPENLLGYVTVSVIDGLAYCKERNIIHRDLKPKNILLNWNGEIKICDFGVSRFLEESKATWTQGTLPYWAPEIFLQVYDPMNQFFDVRADIWSLGITIVEVIRGKHPFITIDNEVSYSPENFHAQHDIFAIQNQVLDLSKKENVIKMLDECLKEKDYATKVREFLEVCLEDVHTRPKYEGLKAMKFYSDYASMTVPSYVRRALKKIGLIKQPYKYEGSYPPELMDDLQQSELFKMFAGHKNEGKSVVDDAKSRIVMAELQRMSSNVSKNSGSSNNTKQHNNLDDLANRSSVNQITPLLTPEDISRWITSSLLDPSISQNNILYEQPPTPSNSEPSNSGYVNLKYVQNSSDSFNMGERKIKFDNDENEARLRNQMQNSGRDMSKENNETKKQPVGHLINQTNDIEQINTNSQPHIVIAEVHGLENQPSPSLNVTDTASSIEREFYRKNEAKPQDINSRKTEAEIGHIESLTTKNESERKILDYQSIKEAANAMMALISFEKLKKKTQTSEIQAHRNFYLLLIGIIGVMLSLFGFIVSWGPIVSAWYQALWCFLGIFASGAIVINEIYKKRNWKYLVPYLVFSILNIFIYGCLVIILIVSAITLPNFMVSYFNSHVGIIKPNYKVDYIPQSSTNCYMYAQLFGPNSTGLTNGDSNFTVGNQFNADHSQKIFQPFSYIIATAVSCSGCGLFQYGDCIPNITLPTTTTTTTTTTTPAPTTTTSITIPTTTSNTTTIQLNTTVQIATNPQSTYAHNATITTINTTFTPSTTVKTTFLTSTLTPTPTTATTSTTTTASTTISAATTTTTSTSTITTRMTTTPSTTTVEPTTTMEETTIPPTTTVELTTTMEETTTPPTTTVEPTTTMEETTTPPTTTAEPITTMEETTIPPTTTVEPITTEGETTTAKTITLHEANTTILSTPSTTNTSFVPTTSTTTKFEQSTVTAATVTTISTSIETSTASTTTTPARSTMLRSTTIPATSTPTTTATCQSCSDGTVPLFYTNDVSDQAPHLTTPPSWSCANCVPTGTLGCWESGPSSNPYDYLDAKSYAFGTVMCPSLCIDTPYGYYEPIDDASRTSLSVKLAPYCEKVYQSTTESYTDSYKDEVRVACIISGIILFFGVAIGIFFWIIVFQAYKNMQRGKIIEELNQTKKDGINLWDKIKDIEVGRNEMDK